MVNNHNIEFSDKYVPALKGSSITSNFEHRSLISWVPSGCFKSMETDFLPRAVTSWLRAAPAAVLSILTTVAPKSVKMTKSFLNE